MTTPLKTVFDRRIGQPPLLTPGSVPGNDGDDAGTQPGVLNSVMNFSPSTQTVLIVLRSPSRRHAYLNRFTLACLCSQASVIALSVARASSGRKHCGLILTVDDRQIDARVINLRPRRIVCCERALWQFLINHATGDLWPRTLRSVPRGCPVAAMTISSGAIRGQHPAGSRSQH